MHLRAADMSIAANFIHSIQHVVNPRALTIANGKMGFRQSQKASSGECLSEKPPEGGQKAHWTRRWMGAGKKVEEGTTLPTGASTVGLSVGRLLWVMLNHRLEHAAIRHKVSWASYIRLTQVVDLNFGRWNRPPQSYGS